MTTVRRRTDIVERVRELEKRRVSDLHAVSGDATGPGTQGPPGDKGDKGDTGAAGQAATIAVGQTVTGQPGSAASVINSGTASAAVLEFTIPRGATGERGLTGDAGLKGDKGDKGDTGTAGQAGTRGSTWTSGTVAPTASGLAGDMYVNTTTFDLYRNAGGTTWTLLGSIKGAAGTNGTNGTNGADGAAGTRGSTWTSGTAAPPTISGLAGDMYLNTATWNVYQCSGGTTWAIVTNLKGATGSPGTNGTNGADGAPGTRGSLWSSGSTVPTASGLAGDMYLHTGTWDVYRCSGGTTWVVVTNIKGTAGTNGTNGTNGSNGTRGSTWTSGTGAPTASALAGDMYVNTTTYDLYQSSGGTSWTLIGNIKGATGAPGTNGTNGTNGATGTRGSLWTVGTAAPPAFSGLAGDMYLNTATSDVYQCAGGTSWTLVANVKGAAGTNGTNGTNGSNGTRGSTWTTGTAAPPTISGLAGDMYLNTATSDVYQCAGGTSWTAVGNIKGSAGAPGARGSTWTTGTAAPPTSAGLAGDMYLNTTTSAVYQNTGGTNWTLVGNIKGATGAVPLLTIGTVTKGTAAAASITGTQTDPVLNLVLPAPWMQLSSISTDATGVGLINHAMGVKPSMAIIQPDLNTSGVILHPYQASLWTATQIRARAWRLSDGAVYQGDLTRVNLLLMP